MNAEQEALLKKINRKLAHYGKGVRWNEDEEERKNFGDFYILDLNRNQKLEHLSDLEGYARQIE